VSAAGEYEANGREFGRIAVLLMTSGYLSGIPGWRDRWLTGFVMGVGESVTQLRASRGSVPGNPVWREAQFRLAAMPCLNGEHGPVHDWRCLESEPAPYALYSCRNCPAVTSGEAIALAAHDARVLAREADPQF
jgi:hypothetical protein